MSKDFTVEVTVDEKTGIETATIVHKSPEKKKATTKKETQEVQQ